MPSDVPAVMNTRSAETGNPFVVYSAATASRAAGMPGRRPVVVVAVAHRALDRVDQVRRRLEPEGDRIADVEIADPRAGGLDFLRFRDDVADGVGEAMNARRGGNRRLKFWLMSRHVRILPMRDARRCST